MELPSWLPQDAWNEYIKMRLKIRKPMTEYAMKLAVRELDKLRRMGHDPQRVLDQSIFKCWQGLYPVKDETSFTPYRGDDSAKRIAATFRQHN